MNRHMQHKIQLEKALYQQMNTDAEELKQWEEDPYLADAETVQKVWNLIEQSPAIEIIGDYDVDGICATYIMMKSIKSVYPEKKIRVRTPKRFSEGYGMNETIINETLNRMPKESLIITVDNGILSADMLETLKQAGYHVILTDHHSLRKEYRIPNVDIVIDPAVEEIYNPLPGRYWCGAGVAYKLCEQMVDEVLATEIQTFAGLATVADCMVLREGNWGLVRKAIRNFREKKAPDSLKLLLSGMKQDPNFCNEDSFGFYLGPCFNAAERLLDGGATEVLKYLYSPTKEKAEGLISLNNERKRIRDEEYEWIKGEIARTGQENSYPIWLTVPNLHEGIVGILAGKVAEEYKCPAIILTNSENKPGVLKGSARSSGTFDIFKYLSSMGELFLKMGGHPGAAGLSMTEEAFKEASQRKLALSKEEVPVDNRFHLKIEQWEIPGMEKVLNKFRPFGESNPAPVFDVEVDYEKDGAKLIGEAKNHLLIMDKFGRYKITHFFHEPNTLSDAAHFGMEGRICGSAFNGIETPTLNADEVYDLKDEKERSR